MDDSLSPFVQPTPGFNLGEWCVCDTVNVSLSFQHSLDMLFEAIKASDENKVLEWSKNEQWATVEEIIKSQGTGTIHLHCFHVS